MVRGKVVNKLHRSCRDSIAIIDQDPGSAQPRTLRSYELIKSISDRGINILLTYYLAGMLEITMSLF